MSDYIRTYTGRKFEPLAPDAENIDIRDIAHALSLICRGNGHVHSFWSVGEHCICCAKEAAARGYEPRLVLACLLHDASECYLSDVPRPFKKDLPAYSEHEDRLLAMIYEKYLGSPLAPDEQRALKEIDDDMLWYDLTILLQEPATTPEPHLRIKIDYTVRPFAETEKEYLTLFEQYSAQVHEEKNS